MGWSGKRFTREFQLAAMGRQEQGVSVGEVARSTGSEPERIAALAA